MKKVSFSLPEAYVKGLERLVKNGLYINKAEAIRHAIKDMIVEEVGFDQSPLEWMKQIQLVDRSEYERKLKRKRHLTPKFFADTE